MLYVYFQEKLWLFVPPVTLVSLSVPHTETLKIQFCEAQDS